VSIGRDIHTVLHAGCDRLRARAQRQRHQEPNQHTKTTRGEFHDDSNVAAEFESVRGSHPRHRVLYPGAGKGDRDRQTITTAVVRSTELRLTAMMFVRPGQASLGGDGGGAVGRLQTL
jgi:hypothetical protein